MSPAEMMNAIGIHLTVSIAKSGEKAGLAEHSWVDRPDGFLGFLGVSQILMEIWFDERIGPLGAVTACTVDGTKTHIPKKNVRPRMRVTPDGEYPVYHRSVEVKVNDLGVARTNYPPNLIRIMRLVPANGAPRIEVYDLSIVSQNGAFFVCFQKMKTVPVFRTLTEAIDLPSIESGSMKELIINFAKDFLGQNPNIPWVDQFVGRSTADGSDLSECQGRVLWFNQAHGLGALSAIWKGTLVQARIHWHVTPESRSQEGRPGLRVLHEGDVISFEKLIQPRMNVAPGYDKPRTTTFEWEVDGEVRVIESAMAFV